MNDKKNLIQINRNKYSIVKGYVDYIYTIDELDNLNKNLDKIIQIDKNIYVLNNSIDKDIYIFYEYDEKSNKYIYSEYMRIERHDDSCTYVLNKKSILDIFPLI